MKRKRTNSSKIAEWRAGLGSWEAGPRCGDDAGHSWRSDDGFERAASGHGLRLLLPVASSAQQFCEMLHRQVLLDLLDGALQLAPNLHPNNFLHLVVGLLPGGEVLRRHFGDELPQLLDDGRPLRGHVDQYVEYVVNDLPYISGEQTT